MIRGAHIATCRFAHVAMIVDDVFHAEINVPIARFGSVR
jgi:hypothetical protein